MSETLLTIRTDGDRVLLNITFDGRGLTAVLSSEEARAVSDHLTKAAAQALVAGRPHGHA